MTPVAPTRPAPVSRRWHFWFSMSAFLAGWLAGGVVEFYRVPVGVELGVLFAVLFVIAWLAGRR